MTFWILVLVLVLGASLLVYLTLGKNHVPDEDIFVERIQRFVRLFREKEVQLLKDVEQGYISDSDYQQLYTEQARELLAHVDRLENMSSKQSANTTWRFSALAIPLIALVLYYSVGAYTDWQIANQFKTLTQSSSEAEYTQKLDAIKADMRARLAQKPDVIEYRLLLAEMAMADDDFSEALTHYSVIAELLPDDAQAQAYYAQALFLANGRKLDADVAKAMDKTLQLDPMQPTVLGMQGIIAFEMGDFAQALEAWQKLITLLPPGSPRANMVEQGIVEAKKLVAASSPDTLASELAPDQNDAQNSVAQEAAEGIPKGIQISLSIDDDLRKTVKPATTVFVFAKAVSGPPMPLAAQRLSLADLPKTIVLDDSTAMMPSMKLSAFDTVTIGARLSLSGNPIAQDGDITVQLSPVKWRESSQHKLHLVSE